MDYSLLEGQLLITNDIESRRVHERYDCAGVRASYVVFGSNYLQAINTPVGKGELKDISLAGLCLEVDRSLVIGETIALKISTVDNIIFDELNAEIMWCQLKSDNKYNVGLRVIKEENIRFDNTGDDACTEQAVHYLICPDCYETSFYIKTPNNSEKQSALHTCCRCNSSHMIAEVVAFNRSN